VDAAMTERFWHYSTGYSLMRMIADGYLLKPGSHGGLMLPGERPAVFFTRRQTWEPTATPAVVDARGRKRTLSVATWRDIDLVEGLCRIGVDAAHLPFSWADFVVTGGLNRAATRALEKSAKRQGSYVSDWRLTYDVLPMRTWTALELWNGREWCSCAGGAKGFALPCKLNDEGYHTIEWRAATAGESKQS
jgi:hypothetical protein